MHFAATVPRDLTEASRFRLLAREWDPLIGSEGVAILRDYVRIAPRAKKRAASWLRSSE
jgi:hypothetical protein